MKKIILILFFTVIVCSCDKSADYEFIGEFKYTISDQKEFEKTYLFNSLGYIIGDKHICGLKIEGIENLSNGSNYL